MELYFAQHGKAMSKDEDPDRPLTDEGREETRRVARAAADLELDAIWHSGKLRARQTAEIFAEELHPAQGLVKKDWLGPTDDPTEAVDAARQAGETVLLVGHLPYMSRLPAILLAGHPDATTVDTRYSGVVAMGEGEDGWLLRWYLRPEIV